MRRRGSWLLLICLATAAAAEAQFGRRFSAPVVATEKDFDGRFHYCRLVYRGGFNGSGGSWRTDYPNADINMSIRLSELTKISVSKRSDGSPNHLLVRVSGDELFECPLVIMSAPGSATFEEDEVGRLREYLLKGGVLWTDDSWGSYQWTRWMAELRKVLPEAEYPIVDLPLDHALFRSQFAVTEIPQIPNIGFFLRSGGLTSEQGADSAVPWVKGISDSAGRLMVLMTHNTDIQDSWEREGDDPSYFHAFSPRGYAFGINAILYAMSH
ncbi:MAG: DUF4159 domain-containing protein [Vicinamibacterales bacterium]